MKKIILSSLLILTGTIASVGFAAAVGAPTPSTFECPSTILWKGDNSTTWPMKNTSSFMLKTDQSGPPEIKGTFNFGAAVWLANKAGVTDTATCDYFDTKNGQYGELFLTVVNSPGSMRPLPVPYYPHSHWKEGQGKKVSACGWPNPSSDCPYTNP